MDIYDPESPTEDDGLQNDQNPSPNSAVKLGNEFEFDLADVPLPPGAAPMPISVPVWSTENSTGRSKKKKKKKKKNKDGSARQDEEMCEDPLFGYPPPLPPAPPPPPPPPSVPPPPPSVAPPRPPVATVSFTSGTSALGGLMGSSLAAVTGTMSPMLPAAAAPSTPSPCISSPGTPLVSSSQEMQLPVEGIEEIRDEPLSLAKQLLNKALVGVFGKGDRSSPSRDEETVSHTVASPLTAGKLKFSLKPPGSTNLQKVSFQIRTKKATLKSTEEDGEDDTISFAPPAVPEAVVMPVRFKKSKQELFRPDLKVGEEMDVADLLMQEQMRIASHSLVAMQAVALLEKSRQAAAEKELAHKSSPDVKSRSPESKSRRGERKDRRSTRDDKKEDRESSEKSRKEGRDKNAKDEGLKDRKHQHERSHGSEEEKAKDRKDIKEGGEKSYSKQSRIQADKDTSKEEKVKEESCEKFGWQSKDSLDTSPKVSLAKAGNTCDTLDAATDVKVEELDKVQCEQSIADTFFEDMDLSPDTSAGNKDDDLENVTETATAIIEQGLDLEIGQTYINAEKMPCKITVDQGVEQESVYSEKVEESKTANYFQESESLKKPVSSKGTSEEEKNLDQNKEVPCSGEEKHPSLGSGDAVQQSLSKIDSCASQEEDRKHDVDMTGGREKDRKQPEEKMCADKDKSTSQPESQSSVTCDKKDTGKKNESHRRPGSREKERVRTRNRSRSRSGSREKNQNSRTRAWRRSRSSSRDRDRTRKFSSRRGSREREERRRRNRSRSNSKETERSSRRRKSRSNSREKDKSKKKEEQSSHASRDRGKERGKEKHKSADLNIKDSRELHNETGNTNRGVLGKGYDRSTTKSRAGPRELHLNPQVSEDDKQGLNNEVGGLEERKARPADSEKRTKMSSREDAEERKQKARSSSPEGGTKQPSKDRDSCERAEHDKADKKNKEMSKTSHQKVGSQSPERAERVYHRERQPQNILQNNKKSRSRSPERVQRRNRRRRSSSSDGNERAAFGRFRSRSRSGSREQRLTRQRGGSDSEEEFFRRRALDWSRDQAYLHYKRRKRSDSSDEEKIPSKSTVAPEITELAQTLSKDQSPPMTTMSSLKACEEVVMQVDLSDILLPGEIPAQQVQADHAKQSKAELSSGDQGEEDMDLDDSFSDDGEPCLDNQQQKNMHNASEYHKKLSSPEPKTMEKITGISEGVKIPKPPEKIQFSLKSSGKGLKLKPRTAVEDLDDEDTAAKSSKLFLPQELGGKEGQSAACILSGLENVQSTLKVSTAEAASCNQEKTLKWADSTCAEHNAEIKGHTSEKTKDDGQKTLSLKNSVEEIDLQDFANFEPSHALEGKSECSSLSALKNDGCKTSQEEDIDEPSQDSLEGRNAKTTGSSPERTKARGRLFKYEPLWELDKKEIKPPVEHPVVVQKTSSIGVHDKAKPNLPISLVLDYGSSSEGEDSEGSSQRCSPQKNIRESRRDRNEFGPGTSSCHKDSAKIPSKSPEGCIEMSFHVISQANLTDEKCSRLPKVVTQKNFGKSLDEDEASTSDFVENTSRQIKGEDVKNSSKRADSRNKFQADKEKTGLEESSEVMPEVTSTDMSAETYFQRESRANPEKTDFEMSLKKSYFEKSPRPFLEKAELEKSFGVSLERASCPENSGPNQDRKRVRKSRFSDRSPPRSLDNVEGAGALELPSSLEETPKSESGVKGDSGLQPVCLPLSRQKSTGEEVKRCTGTKRASRFGPPVQPFEEGLKESESHLKDKEDRLATAVDDQNSGPVSVQTRLNANFVEDFSHEQEKDLADPFSVRSEKIDSPSKLSLVQNVDKRNDSGSLGHHSTVVSDEYDTKDLTAENVSACTSIGFELLPENVGSSGSDLLLAPGGLGNSSVAGSDGVSLKIMKMANIESVDSVCSSAVKAIACDLPSMPVLEIKSRDVYQDPEISIPTEEPSKETEISSRKPGDSCLEFHEFYRHDSSSSAPILCSGPAVSDVKEESDEAFRSVQRAVFLAEKSMGSSGLQTAVTGEKTFIEPSRLGKEQPKFLGSRQNISCAAKSTFSSHSLEVVSSAAESTTDGGIYKQHQPFKVKDPLSKALQRHQVPAEMVTSVKPPAPKMSEPVFDSSGSIVKAGKIQIIIGKKVAAVSGYPPETEIQKQNTASEPAGGFPVQVVTSTRNTEEGLGSELIWPDFRAVAAKEVEDARAEEESKSSSSDTCESTEEEEEDEEEEEEEESEEDDQQDTPGSVDNKKPDSYDSHRRDITSRDDRSGDHRHRELSADENRKCSRWDIGDDRERRQASDERICRQNENDHRKERERLNDRREKEEEDRKRRDRERERDRERWERERQRERQQEEERRRRRSHQSSTERSFQRNERNRRRSQSPDRRKRRSRERSHERASSTEQSYQRNDRNKRIQSPDWRRGRSREKSQERGSSTEKSYHRNNRNRRRSRSPDWRRSRSRERSQERASSIERRFERNNRNRRRSPSPDWRRGRSRERSKERASSIEKTYQRKDRNRSQSPDWGRGRSHERSQERASSSEQSYRRSHDKRRSRSQSPDWKRGRSREHSQEGASDCDHDKAKENRNRRPDERERTRHDSQDRFISESCKERVLDWNQDRNYKHSRDRSGDFILVRTRDEIQDKLCEDGGEKPIDYVMQDHGIQRSHEYIRSRMRETSLDRTGDHYSERVRSHSQERVTERRSSSGHDYSQGVSWNRADRVSEDINLRASDYDRERLGRGRDRSRSCSRERELRVSDQKWEKREETTFPVLAGEVQTYTQSVEAVQPAVLSAAVPFYPPDPIYQVSQEGSITGQLLKQNQGYDVYAKVYPEQPCAGWAAPLPTTVDIASLHVVQQHYQALGYPAEQALSLAHQYLAGDPAAQVAYTQTHVDPSAYALNSNQPPYPYVSGSTSYSESYPPGVLPMEYRHSLVPGGDYSHTQHSSYGTETLPQGYSGTVVPAPQFPYESLVEMEAHLQAEMHPDPREAALFGDLPSFRKPRNSKKQRGPLLPTPLHVPPRLQTDQKVEISVEQTFSMDKTLSTVVSSEPEFATSSLAEPTFETSHLAEGAPATTSPEPGMKRCLVDERLEKDGDEVVSSTNSSVDASESALKDDLHFSSSESKPMKVKSRWRRSSEAEAVVEASSSSTTLSESLSEEDGRELGGDQDVDSLPPPPPPSKCMRTEAEEKQLQEKSAADSYPVFEVITENIHLTQRKKSKSMKRMVCDCTTSKSDRAMGITACGSDCLNRMLMIECGSRCPCLDYCTNKRFQKKQYCKTLPFNAGVGKGWGLQAAEDLPEKGAFVMEYVGELLDYKEFVRRTRQYARQGLKHHYFMALNADEVVDATQKGSTSRFMNHSCDPNCETQKWTVNGELRVGFFTKKPVTAGEELTFDYQFEFYGDPQKCYCGSEKCRGFIGGQKISPAKKRKDKAEKRKMELFEDEMLDEDIQQMCQLKDGMRNKKHVLEVCRLMVRAEKQEHRLAILQIIQDTTEMNCLSLFLGYHGLPLLWSWMMDIGSGDSDDDRLLKRQVLQVLSMLPINNKTILKESKIMPIVEKWASLLPPPLPPEQEADSVCEPLPLPVPPSKPVISILACSKDYKEPKAGKKRVTFADEATSSDSDLSDTLRISSTSSTNGDQSGESAVSTSSLSSTTETSVNVEDAQNIQKAEIVSSADGDSLPISAASLEPEETKQQEVENAESVVASTEADKVEGPVTRRRSSRRLQTPQCEASESKGRVLRSSRRKRFSSEEPSQVADSTSQRQDDVGKTEAKNDSDKEPEDLGASAEADASSTNKDSIGKSDEELAGMSACATSLTSQETDDPGNSTASLGCVGVLAETQATGRDSTDANQAEAQSSQATEIESVVSGMAVGSLQSVDDGTENFIGLAGSENAEGIQEMQSSEKSSELGELADDGGKSMSDVLPVEFESADEITILALSLLQGWSELKELYKIPKKQRVEERKRTERELESVVFKEPEKREMDPYAKWKRKTAAKPRKKDIEEEELRKRNLVLVGPRMSKEERRQLFEAQVKAEDEMAEMQRQQEAIQQQHQQDTAFFLQQNPAFVSILHGVASGDPSIVGAHGQVLDPSLLYGAGVLTPEQQQAAAAFAGLLNAPGMSGDAVTAAQQLLAHHSLFPVEQYQVPGVYQQPSAATVFPDATVTQQLALQHLALQQITQRQQPFQAAADPQRGEEEDVPPPPSPPKSKEPSLPPNWKTARDGEGRVYYYHTVTRQTQWDPPSWESNSPEDMDFDLPDPELEPDEKGKKKTTTAAADTSSEVAKKIKDQFRRQMSQFVVVYLNPYRKPDCKVGRITSTEEFKHLARKLTHHVMAKELKHCRHVEDLEVNENVKAKAKDYVRKYMSRFGALYKKTMSPQPEDL